MRTLILSDEAWAKLPAGVRNRLLSSSSPELPDGTELHRMARAKEEPAAFVAARDRLQAVDDARDAMKDRMHELILQAHGLGVGPKWLAEWSGYNRSRIFQILDEKKAA